MKKEKKNNIVVGPWDNSSSNPPNLSEEEIKEMEIKKMSEDFHSIDVLTENIVVQIIQSLKEQDFDITSTVFIRDVAFLNECVKAMLRREYGYEHPISDLVGKLFEIEKRGDKFLTKFAVDKLSKVVKDL